MMMEVGEKNIISGTIVLPTERRLFTGSIVVENRRIVEVREESVTTERYLLPGFVDSHVHIESSMLVPTEFARVAVLHGTVATVSDPHEIANVLGVEGVRFMIENGERSPFKFFFGAPSCVPATEFETAGARLQSQHVEELLNDARILYLSEMMNYPGVLFDDPEVLAKIEIARRVGKPIDGHAPGLRGENLDKYIAAGITTDHEAFTYEEGKEKIEKGMKLLIREGSAAKNFDTLHPLLSEYPDSCMFCSDDKHPDDLLRGHVNMLVRRALIEGHDLMTVLRAASVHPVEHYGLNVGLLRVGDPADFIEVDNLKDFQVERTWIEGEIVAERGQTKLPAVAVSPVNNFQSRTVLPEEVVVDWEQSKGKRILAIRAIDGEIVTEREQVDARVVDGKLVTDAQRDLLKIVVVNRYEPAKPAVGFIRGFGLREGAIASSVAHDSHNVVAVGCADVDICAAINLVMESEGGLSLASGEKQLVVGLPVAGLMSDGDAWDVAEQYSEIDRSAKEELGTTLTSPYMTLSFMSLLVIPRLKLSDKGLFDGDEFSFVELDQT